MAETTIKVDTLTTDKLKKLKIHPRQSYEEVILALLTLIEEKKEDNSK